MAYRKKRGKRCIQYLDFTKSFDDFQTLLHTSVMTYRILLKDLYDQDFIVSILMHKNLLNLKNFINL